MWNPGLATWMVPIAAIAAEREACATVATDRAIICHDAYNKGDIVEVHTLNEALHIAQVIRSRGKP